VQYTHQLIGDGRLGELTHYRGRFFSMYGRDRLGLLSWRFIQDEAGYGVLSDIMSHAIDMAQYMCGPIRRVVATKETFVKERPLPVPGSGTHYDRGKPGDPTGAVTNEDYVGALVEFENGVRGTLEADRRKNAFLLAPRGARLELHTREAQGPSDRSLDDIHVLDSVERDRPVRPIEDAAVDPDLARPNAVLEPPPVKKDSGGHESEQEQDGNQRRSQFPGNGQIADGGVKACHSSKRTAEPR